MYPTRFEERKAIICSLLENISTMMGITKDYAAIYYFKFIYHERLYQYA